MPLSPGTGLVLRSPGPPERKWVKPFKGLREEDIDAWLFRLEKDFQLRGVPEEAKAVTAAFGLEGSAWSWYRSWELSHGREPLWVEFKRDIIRRYRAPDHEERIRFKLAELKQKGDILDFIGKFQDLAAQLTFKSDPDLKTYFLRGLRPQTQSEVMYRNPDSLEEAIEIASRYEASHYHLAKYEQTRPQTRPSPLVQSGPQYHPVGRGQPRSPWKPSGVWYRRPQGSPRSARPPPPSVRKTPTSGTTQTPSRAPNRPTRYCSYCGRTDHQWFQCSQHKPKTTNIRTTQVQPRTAPRQSPANQQEN